MPISPEPQSDPATADDANKGPSPGWLLASLVLYIGVERLVSLFGVPAMGEAAAYSALGFAIMLTVFWKKHGEKWFWLFVIIDVILHIGAIIFVPWSGTHHDVAPSQPSRPVY